MLKETDSRFEMKYRLDAFTYLELRGALLPYMRKDEPTARAGGKGYLVRSVYYDTDDFQCYEEKQAGNNRRQKFRFRTYSRTLTESSILRAEIKMRIGAPVLKQTAFVPLQAYQAFLETGHWNMHHPVLETFDYHRRRMHLHPKVLVEYQREGYRARLPGDDLRVTFDHGVQSAQAKTLLETPVSMRAHYPGEVILEIKFRDAVPAWLHRLVRAYGLKCAANSKYAQAVQLSRKELAHPNNVIMIR